jgi:protein ImuB
MQGLPHPVLPAESLPEAQAAPRYRRADALWLALQLLEPRPAAAVLESLASWARSLTPVVVLRPDEGLLLEVQGSLRYFSGLANIRQRLLEELERRGWVGRLATAPTPLAATWIVRCTSAGVSENHSLAGAIGCLPLAATAWPERVQRMLGEMGLRSIGDCLRLPRAGFARRIGRNWLDELDRALGKTPDVRCAWQAPATLSRSVEFPLETNDRAWFAEALRGMVGALEQELRQRQAQVTSVTLFFRHARCSDTLTQMNYVEPVHTQVRLLSPLLARIERMVLAEPVIALALETSTLLPLRTDPPELLLPLPGDSPGDVDATCSDLALVERLRGRFGARGVFGIDAVAEHRPEYAWQRRLSERAANTATDLACFRDDRPLWLLPSPKKWGQSPFPGLPSAGGRVRTDDFETLARRDERAEPAGYSRRVSKSSVRDRPPLRSALKKKGSDPIFPERVESGWWDGQDVRRDYHVVTGASGEKLWLFRDCLTEEWYLHGIFG